MFEHNAKAAGADLRNLDFVVISHRHADHTSGITYLLTINPNVRIYVPDEPWGLFARGVGNDFYRKDPSLPAEMRYFGGHPPDILDAGTPWPGANFTPRPEDRGGAWNVYPSRRFQFSGHAGVEGAVAGHQEPARPHPDCRLLAPGRGAHPASGGRD